MNDRAARKIESHLANLASPDPRIWCRAQRYLRLYGVRAFQPLLSCCNHESAEMRWRAVWLLASTRHPDAFEAILRLCGDPDEGVRYESRVALGILGDDRCLSELVRMVVEHDDLDDAAMLGLERMMPAAFPYVDALFRRGDLHVRRGLVNLIGCVAAHHAHAGAIALLEQMTEDEDEFVRHEGRWWLQELKERGVKPSSPAKSPPPPSELPSL